MNFESWSLDVLELMAEQFAKCKSESDILASLQAYHAAWKAHCITSQAEADQLTALSVRLHQLPVGRVRKSRAKSQSQKFDS